MSLPATAICTSPGAAFPVREECHILDRSEAALMDITGKKPLGHRGPESIIHPFTPQLLQEREYLYSSSMKDCDWPYLWEVDGQTLPLVELPCDITMDDFTYYYFTFSDPAVRAMYTNREVFQNWKQEFDALAEEGNKLFILKLHPQMIGRASRIAWWESWSPICRLTVPGSLPARKWPGMCLISTREGR